MNDIPDFGAGRLDERLGDQIREVCQSVSQRGRVHWWLKPEVSRAFEVNGYHLLPRHFYSPVPDPDVIAGYDWTCEAFPLSRLRFDEHDCIRTCLRLIDEASALEYLPAHAEPDSNGYYWNNVMFTGLDAVVLYGLIRRVRPRRIVEIGSGFSTRIAQLALRANGIGEITCIEPYPSPTLLELRNEVTLIQCTVQQTEVELFDRLEANDILFIDSSHVSALGSDVNVELFKILPRVKSGVYIHFHDIFFPFDYPALFVDERRWFWNEQYLLYAFLLFNPAFEIMFPIQYLLGPRWSHIRARAEMFAHPLRSGVSFWMRRS